mmetsp:Transcript_65656/g.170874  ORF Transcript_65656/g.170874 Transcript_65656/m.170874 type:complete len:328 (-) Transcript_65656:141-1124(-)
MRRHPPRAARLLQWWRPPCHLRGPASRARRGPEGHGPCGGPSPALRHAGRRRGARSAVRAPGEAAAAATGGALVGRGPERHPDFGAGRRRGDDTAGFHGRGVRGVHDPAPLLPAEAASRGAFRGADPRGQVDGPLPAELPVAPAEPFRHQGAPDAGARTQREPLLRRRAPRPVARSPGGAAPHAGATQRHHLRRRVARGARQRLCGAAGAGDHGLRVERAAGAGVRRPRRRTGWPRQRGPRAGVPHHALGPGGAEGGPSSGPLRASLRGAPPRAEPLRTAAHVPGAGRRGARVPAQGRHRLRSLRRGGRGSEGAGEDVRRSDAGGAD